jgi:hypothetical protein
MNFERGQDPKEAMGLGIYGMHKFKDDYDACDFIMSIFPAIMEVDEISDLPENCLYSGTPQWDKLSKYTVNCIRVDGIYEPTYNNPDGSLLGLIRMRLEDQMIVHKLIELGDKKGYEVRKK